MAEQDERYLNGRITFNIPGRQYYVLGENSGLPAADFWHGSGKKGSAVIVRRDWDHTGEPWE